MLAHLATHGIPDPDLNDNNINTPTTEIPLETFHRSIRAALTLYEPQINLTTKPDGLYMESKHVRFQINHHKYKKQNTATIDPQKIYEITRSIRDRERIESKIQIENKQITIQLDFPWIKLTTQIPT